MMCEFAGYPPVYTRPPCKRQAEEVEQGWHVCGIHALMVRLAIGSGYLAPKVST